jgi:putative toxin-antitoxin system antitoxin component (TIGR02293 family)
MSNIKTEILPAFHALNITDKIEMIERGLPFSFFSGLRTRYKIPVNTLAALMHMPSRTLHRRIKSRNKFLPGESERMLRIAEILEKAAAYFGGRERAMQWLKTPQRGLGGKTPLAFAKTGPGAQEVKDLLIRLEHGVFS